jgi:hypothetical protein
VAIIEKQHSSGMPEFEFGIQVCAPVYLTNWRRPASGHHGSVGQPQLADTLQVYEFSMPEIHGSKR